MARFWWLAKKLNILNGEYVSGFSREQLENLGFVIITEEDLFYKVVPPPGWKESPGNNPYWTYFLDSKGREVISQFYKAEDHDTRAFVNIRCN